MRVYLIVSYLILCCSNVSQTFNGTVVGIIDGDTIDVLINKTSMRIRVEGIDCPEKNQDFGSRAKQFTSTFCFGREVVIKKKEFDKYDRMVAMVKLLDGTDLSESLLLEGLAWHYKKYDNSIKLAELENLARTQKIGIWSLPNPVAPWCFRHPERCN